MVVAELEVYHSRPIAPTRRVSLGKSLLPTDPPPGFGGILLGGIVAQNIGGIDPDLIPDLMRLTTELEEDRGVAQPRLRYRFQEDKVGLQRSRHRLIGQGEALHFEFDDDHGLPTQQVLGAVYAAGRVDHAVRHAVMGAVRRAVRWEGTVGDDLISVLAGRGPGSTAVGLRAGEPPVVGAGHPRVPARRAGPSTAPERSERAEVQSRFREQLREAHPDHGGDAEAAAQRITELTEARRILLG